MIPYYKHQFINLHCRNLLCQQPRLDGKQFEHGCAALAEMHRVQREWLPLQSQQRNSLVPWRFDDSDEY